MSLRYDIDFEVGDFSEWETETGLPDSDIVVSSPGLASSGERCVLGYELSSGPVRVSNDLGLLGGLGTIMRFGCIIRMDSLLFSGSVPRFGWLSLNNLFTISVIDGGSGTFDIFLSFSTGSGPDTLTASVGLLNNTEHTVEIRIQKSSADATADGEFQIYVDGVEQASNTAVDNFTEYADGAVDDFNLFPQSAFGLSDPGGGISVDGIIFRDDDTPIFNTNTRLWVSTDGAATFSNIGDSTWTGPVRAIYVKPGLSDNTIWVAVGTGIYFTDDGGSSWTLKATLTFAPEAIDGLPADDSIIAYTKDAAGTNRFAIIADTVITYRDSGHSTTGEGSAVRGVA